MAHEPRGWTPLGGQQLFQPAPTQPPSLPMGPGVGLDEFPVLRLLPSPPSLFSSPELNGRQMMSPPALEAAGMLLNTRTGARGVNSGVSTNGYTVRPGMAIVPAQYRQQEYMTDPTLSPFRQPQQPSRVNNKRQRPVTSEEGTTWRNNQVQEPQRLYQQLQRQQLQEQTQQEQQQRSAQMQQQRELQRQQQQSRQQYPQMQQQQFRQQTSQSQIQLLQQQQRQEVQSRQQQQQFQIQQQQELQRLQQQIQLQRQQQELQKEQQRQLQQQHRLLQQQQEMDQEQEDRIKAHFGSRIWSNEQHQSRAASAIDPHFQPLHIQTQHFRSFPSLNESEISPQRFRNVGMFRSSIEQQRIPQQQQFQSFAFLADHSTTQPQKRSPMTMSYEPSFQQSGFVSSDNQSVTNQASSHLDAHHFSSEGMQWSTNEEPIVPVSCASSSGAESRLTGSFRIDELLSAASAMDDPLSPSHNYSANCKAPTASEEPRAVEVPKWPLLNTTTLASSFSASPTWQIPQASKVNLHNAHIMQRSTIPGVLLASVAINRLQEQIRTPSEETRDKAKSKPRPRPLKKSMSVDQPPMPSSPEWVVPGGFSPFGNALQSRLTVESPADDRMRIESLLKTKGEPTKRKSKAKPRTNKNQSLPASRSVSSATTPTATFSLGPLSAPAISPTNDQQSVADVSKQAAPALQVAQELAPTEDVNRPPAVNPTVLIFCRRDFMRYQAVKLWKKYEEKKKKRELVSARTTGKRRRYLNSRNEEAAAITQV